MRHGFESSPPFFITLSLFKRTVSPIKLKAELCVCRASEQDVANHSPDPEAVHCIDALYEADPVAASGAHGIGCSNIHRYCKVPCHGDTDHYCSATWSGSLLRSNQRVCCVILMSNQEECLESVFFVGGKPNRSQLKHLILPLPGPHLGQAATTSVLDNFVHLTSERHLGSQPKHKPIYYRDEGTSSI